MKDVQMKITGVSPEVTNIGLEIVMVGDFPILREDGIVCRKEQIIEDLQKRRFFILIKFPMLEARYADVCHK